MNNSVTNKKKLLFGTGIYAVGTFGTKILMFLIAPLYTYYLQTSEMGTYDLLMSTMGLLIPIISLQISDAAYRWIIREKENKRYIVTTYQFLLCGSFFTCVLIAIVNKYIIRIPFFQYFLGALITAMLFQISQKIVRGLNRQWLFAISGVVYTIVFLLLNIIQLCFLHKGVDSLLMSYIIANVAGLITIYVLEKRLRINLISKIDTKTLKLLLTFSVPLIPNYLSWWIIDSSDRFIVLWFLGISSNGILAISHKFPTVLQSVFGLFINSWQDLAVSSDSKEDSFFTSVFEKLYKLSFMFLWTLIPFTKFLVWLVMGLEYKTACDYIPFYYIGSVLQAFCSFYGVGYLRSKKTKLAFTSSIFGAVLNAIVNISFIKIIGLHAAPFSTFLSFFIMFLIREKQNRNELGIKVKWRLFYFMMLSDVFICLVSILVGPWENLIITIIALILCVILCWKDLKIYSDYIIRKFNQKS